MLDVPKIQEILKRASCWDPYDAPFGGSYLHGHLFRPAIPLSELEVWEELMEITLPEDYRCYLTCLGNGGAGPEYGIFPFAFPLDEHLRRESVYSSGHEQRFKELARRRYEDESADVSELYREYCESAPENEAMSLAQFDDALYETLEREVYGSLYQDGLLIANAGCNADIGLLLNGSLRGYVGGISNEYDFHNLAPDFVLKKRLEQWQPFGDYFMDYVKKAEAMCDTLPVEKKTQLLLERDTIVQFQDAMERRDLKELRFLISSIRIHELSEKSRFFYMYHRHALRRELPEDPVVTAFCGGLEQGEGRRWNYQRYKGFYDPESKRVMDGPHDTRCPYAVPTFQQFFQTFLDIGEKRWNCSYPCAIFFNKTERQPESLLRGTS